MKRRAGSKNNRKAPQEIPEGHAPSWPNTRTRQSASLRGKGPYARISVHVKPSARTSEILGFKDDCLELRVAAPPEKGKANEEVVDFLAKSLGIAKGDVSILSGATARRKVVGIAGLDIEEVMRRLSKMPGG